MKEPKSFYKQKIEVVNARISQLKTQLVQLAALRFFTFVAIAAAIYFLYTNVLLLVLSILGGIALFLYLVNIYTGKKSALKYQEKLKRINELEIAVLGNDLSGLNTGNEYIYELHHFNQDIDLFGEGSLFQYINRTELKNGERLLAHILNANDIQDIQEKQEAIQELTQKADWRQNYQATAGLIEADINPNHIVKWSKEYKPFVPKVYKFIPIAFSIASVTIFTLFSMDILTWYAPFVWFLVGLAITAPYVKKVSALYNTTDEFNKVLRQYSKLLHMIESEAFRSKRWNYQKDKIKTSGVKASVRLHQLSRELDHLENRNNFLLSPILNGFFLSDLYFSRRIEQWLEDFDDSMGQWFKTIENFDAWNSLANYSFNHPSFIYPEIASDKTEQLYATELGHPLLNPDKMVKNDVTIKEHEFFIITGANMAGKSTFLRTIGVNLVMANTGLPVCASSFRYTPVMLISSMRTSDSLVNDESYFFSELKRLKFIVEALKKDNYFIILDEILKGTNSKDKAEGSRKFVERLVASNSTGLIATHDLSLCSLEEQLPEIRNYYFDAEIVNDELYFDYTFKKGVCQNMNASFLLRKMEIV